MKMARASRKDLDTAFAVLRLIESLEHGYLLDNPADADCESQEVDVNHGPDAVRIVESLLNRTGGGSLGRVIFGMDTVLNSPVTDKHSDTLEVNPDILKLIHLTDDLYEQVLKQASKLVFQDYSALNELGMTLSALKKQFPKAE